MPLAGPLHRRARAFPFGQAQVVADADFVAVLHHRRQAPADATVLARLPIGGPRRRLLTGKDDPLAMVLRPLVGPDVPVAEERMLVGPRSFEPRAIHRGMVDDQVDDDSDAERLRVIHEVDEVADPVAVCVLALLDVEAIDDRVLVPEVINRHRDEASNADASVENSKSQIPNPYKKIRATEA